MVYALRDTQSVYTNSQNRLNWQQNCVEQVPLIDSRTSPFTCFSVASPQLSRYINVGIYIQTQWKIIKTYKSLYMREKSPWLKQNTINSRSRATTVGTARSVRVKYLTTKNKTKGKEQYTKIKLHQTVSRPDTAVLGHENPLRTRHTNLSCTIKDLCNGWFGCNRRL